MTVIALLGAGPCLLEFSFAAEEVGLQGAGVALLAHFAFTFGGRLVVANQTVIEKWVFT